MGEVACKRCQGGDTNFPASPGLVEIDPGTKIADERLSATARPDQRERRCRVDLLDLPDGLARHEHS